MVRILLPLAATLAACTPSPQESSMDGPSRDPGNTAMGSSEAASEGEPSSASNQAAPNPTVAKSTGRGAGDQQPAALGPIPEAVPVTQNPLPASPADTSAEAVGRRTLSTAFVMVGPDGHLTVELRNGRTLVLRDVIMRPKDYCGAQVLGGAAGKKYCGGYAEVAGARPGGGPAPGEPDRGVPIPSPRSPAKGN
jgi:hypothetical protein